MVLTKDKRTVRKILTIDGFQEIKRYRLYAINKDEYPNSIERCKELYGDTSVYPLDMYLGIDKLPFKVMPDAALRIARLGGTAHSYKDAVQMYKEAYGVTLSDNIIRKITDYCAEIILWDDQKRTEEAVLNYIVNKFSNFIFNTSKPCGRLTKRNNSTKI